MTEPELEIKKETQTGVKPKQVRVLLGFFDKILKTSKTTSNQVKLDTSLNYYSNYLSQISDNKGLGFYFTSQNLDQSNSELGFGNSRCCKLIDIQKIKEGFQKGKPQSSALYTLHNFAQIINWSNERLLSMEDVIQNQIPGTSVNELLSEAGQKEFCNLLTSGRNFKYPEDIRFIYNDPTKILLIYTHAQQQGLADQDFARELHLIDDNQDILNNLATFFNKFPQLIPKGTKLKLVHYDPEIQRDVPEKDIPQLRYEIKGTGEINENYRDTLLVLGKKFERLNKCIDLDRLIQNKCDGLNFSSFIELDDQTLNQSRSLQDLGLSSRYFKPHKNLQDLKELSGLPSLSGEHQAPLIEKPREKSVFALFSAGLISIVSLGSPFLWPAVATAFGIPALFSAYYREKLTSKTKKSLLGLGAVLVAASTAFVMLATFGVGPFDFLGGASVFDILPGYVGLFTGILLPIAMMACMLVMIYQEYQNIKTGIPGDHAENSKGSHQDQNSSLDSHTSKHSVSNSIHNSDQSKSDLIGNITSDAENEPTRPQETKKAPRTVTQTPIYTAKPSSRKDHTQSRNRQGSNKIRGTSGHSQHKPRTRPKFGLKGHSGLLQALRATIEHPNKNPSTNNRLLTQPQVGNPTHFTLFNEAHKDKTISTPISPDRTSGTPSPISPGTPMHDVIIDGANSSNLAFGAGQTSQ
jgi:uncharacterized membrane protein